MSKNLKILFPVSLVLIFFSKIAIGAEDLERLIPDAPEEWVKSDSLEIYNRENLFDYIDGGAEVYLAYDFQQVAVQKYVHTNQDSIEEKGITVEIWQMSSPEDAYGVFSLDQEGEKVAIGKNGIYNTGYLRFWKNVYVVRILQMVGNSNETIFQLGKEIEQKIKEEGKIPSLVQQVPLDSLVPNSVCFFHKQIIMNNLYSISAQNQLDLNTQTDCVLAVFRVCDDRLKLLLIRYPDTTRAKAVERNLKALYMAKNGLATDKIFMSHENGLLGIVSSGDHLILVFHGKDKQNILWLLAKAVSSLEGGETKAEPRCFRYR